jgi:hypothetical protein
VLATTCIVGLLVACGGESAPESGAPNELTGVIVDVDSERLGDVRGFRLRSEGETFEIAIDPDVRFDDFPLTHLSDHLASAEPVRVEIDERGGELFATSVEDA